MDSFSPVIKKFGMRRVERDDPRYPAEESIREIEGRSYRLLDVYVFDVETSNGPFEVPFFVLDSHSPLSPRMVAGFLRNVADAVEELKIDIPEAA